jgi:anti-sigma regulatory factor (Ser/Thr protein kinase)
MTAAPVQESFEHEVLFYRGDADFLAGLVPFVRQGLARDETVVVAEPRSRLEQLRHALGADAAAVQWLDMDEIGGNPARIIAVWAAALESAGAAGRVLRGVGEPAFVGRRDAELLECQLHELLLNRAFDGGPAWRLLCPYDEDRLPAAVTSAALRAHPIRSTSGCRGPSTDYAPAGDLEAFAARLPAPTGSVLRGVFGPDDVPATRRTVAQYASSCGLSPERVEVLELAASELATNSVRHGGGTGTLALWLEPGAVVVEFTDAGRIHDPMAGRRRPTLDQEGGRGLYLVHQLCDLVQIRSSDEGTAVRVSTWL